MTSASPDRVRFGTFELDARTGELLRRGMHVRLQHQPCEVLCALLERPGEVVTREELRARLWRNGAHVDFERSLNKAMVKLRNALGDDAASPRFVETVQRHGYRFIADVHRIEPAPAGFADAAAAIADEPDQGSSKFPVERLAAASRRRGAFALGALCLLALAAAWWLTRPPPPLRIVQSTQLTHTPTIKRSPVLSDGSALYFPAVTAGGIKVMRLPLDGGEAQMMDFGRHDFYLYAIAPDGSALLGAIVPPEARSRRDQPLWVLPLHGRAPQRLGGISAHAADWARDGRIYFAVGNELRVAGADGGDVHKLLSVERDVIRPRVSPDGRRLRYSVYEGAGRWALWEASIEGHAAHRLFRDTPGLVDACCGEWTADGSTFVFQSTQHGRTDLWQVDKSQRWRPGDGTPLRLSSGPMILRSPLPATDGHHVFVIGEKHQGELMRYDDARGEFVRFLGGISAQDVSFSDDGQWVAFVGYPDGSLWRSRVDGSDRRRLTTPPFVAGVPDWSPDGRRIAFTGREDADRNWTAYLISADGGSPEPVALVDRDEFGASWAPDGSALVLGGMPDDRQSALRTFDLASRKSTPVPDSTSFAAPVWSHDGTTIFAQAADPERIVAFDVASGRWSDVYAGAFRYWEVSHDDAWIYFDRGIGSEPGIYRVPVSGGDAEKVVDLTGMRRAAGQFGPWFDLTPDDSPMLLRDTSSEQIYSLALARR